jgi:hypothetical protein
MTFCIGLLNECDKNPSDSLVTDTRSWMDSLHLSVFFLRFIAKTVCTVCSRTSSTIVPLNNVNKCFYNDTSETEVNIHTSINNGSGNKKNCDSWQANYSSICFGHLCLYFLNVCQVD